MKPDPIVHPTQVMQRENMPNSLAYRSFDRPRLLRPVGSDSKVRPTAPRNKILSGWNQPTQDGQRFRATACGQPVRRESKEKRGEIQSTSGSRSRPPSDDWLRRFRFANAQGL